jgi:chemotaxis protein methyltransferase CheR
MGITDAEFSYIRNLLKERSALLLERGKEYLVESRLGTLAQQEGFQSLGQMVENLRAFPSTELHRKVVEAMMTHETSFFREIRVFEMFRKTILPQILTFRARTRTLNFWCAACAGGQEPYSFTMLMREHFPSLRNWNVKFIASDISRAMLARARAGRYSQLEVNRGLPAHLLVKYFQKWGAGWEIVPEVRSMIEFREINLVRPWPSLGRMDGIFMRNVLIYLDGDIKKTILAKAGQLLEKGGFVLLGSAETTAHIDDAFEPVSSGGAVYFRLKAHNDLFTRAEVSDTGPET